MRLALLACIAVAAACFLAREDPVAPADDAWTTHAHAIRTHEAPAPQLQVQGAMRRGDVRLLESDPDAFFEELLSVLVQEPKQWSRSLGRLRSAGGRIYPVLIRQLACDEDLPCAGLRRHIATLLLSEAGPAAAPYLLTAVREGDPSVAAAAAIELYWLSGDVDACLPALIRYLDGPVDWQRSDPGAALRVIAAMSRPPRSSLRSAVPVLIKLLDVPHSVRKNTEMIFNTRSTAWTTVRAYAHEILSSMGPDAEPAIRDLERSLLQGASRANRFAVLHEVGINARTLSRVGPRGRVSLMRLLDHDDALVRGLIAGALIKMQGGVSALTRATRDSHPNRRAAAIKALAGHSDLCNERVVEALVPRLHDPRDDVKVSAAWGLAVIGAREADLRAPALCGLAGCLHHGDPAARSAALRALLAFKHTAPSVGRSVAAILHQLDGVPFRCAVAVIARSGTTDEDVARALRTAGRRCEDRDRTLIAQALARVVPGDQAAPAR